MKKKKIERNGKASFVKALLFGVVTGASVWMVLLVIAAFAISGRSEPENYIIPAVFVLAAVSAASAGIMAVKMSKSSVLLCGIASGGALVALVWVLSLAFSGSGGEESLLLKLLLCADFLVFAVLCAKLGASSPKKRVKHGK